MPKKENIEKDNQLINLIKQNNNYSSKVKFSKYFHICQKDTYFIHDKYICTYIIQQNISSNIFFALKNNISGEGYIFDKNNNKYIKGHSQMISKLIIDYKNNYLISCSYDKLIIIWRLSKEKNNLEILNELKGHKGRIYDMDLISNKDELLSCGMDRNILLWNIKEFSLIKKIYLNSSIHNLIVKYYLESDIKNEKYPNEWLFVYSKNQTVNCIDFNTDKIIESFNIHCYDGSLLLVDNEKFIYQKKKSYDIVIYNFKIEEIAGIFIGCKHEIQIILNRIKDNKIISFDIGNNIKIWNYTKKFCELTIKIDFVLIYLYITRNGKLLCGSINKIYIYE